MEELGHMQTNILFHCRTSSSTRRRRHLDFEDKAPKFEQQVTLVLTKWTIEAKTYKI